MQEHPAALDYDCMTLTGRTLHEYADMGWQGMSSLAHLVRHLGPESMTWRATHEGDELPSWTSRPSTNAILADIYDVIAQLTRLFVIANSKSKPQRPRPYPRPNARDKGEVIGKGAIRVADFDSWWGIKTEDDPGDGPEE